MTNNGVRKAVADPGLQIREGGGLEGGGGHPDPQIRRGPGHKYFFGPSGLSLV